MSVNFKAVPKKNPQLPAEPPKFYAHLVSTGDLTLRQLAKQIAARSTVSAADTLAVLESLLEVIPESLADGKIVRLGDFGSFSLTASSEGMGRELYAAFRAVAGPATEGAGVVV